MKAEKLIACRSVGTIGFAQRNRTTRYIRDSEMSDNFFEKRELYADNKEIQQNNLQKKIELCI